MKFVPVGFVFFAWICSACSHPAEEHATLLDSLLYIPNEEGLRARYGADHVRDMHNIRGDGKGSFASLFDGTSVHVFLEWNHDVNVRTKRGVRRVKISQEHLLAPRTGVRKWTTGAGIVPGMTLKELEKRIGEFHLTVGKRMRKTIKTVYQHESDSITYTIYFDPELKFTRALLKLEKFYASSLPELQDENPEIYAVELAKEFPLLVAKKEENVQSAKTDAAKDSIAK